MRGGEGESLIQDLKREANSLSHGTRQASALVLEEGGPPLEIWFFLNKKRGQTDSTAFVANLRPVPRDLIEEAVAFSLVSPPYLLLALPAVFPAPARI